MIVKLSDIRPQPPKLSGHPGEAGSENPQIQQLIRALSLTPHVEGGYFVETDRDERKIALSPNDDIHGINSNKTDPEAERSLSTSTIYCLTSQSPIGAFHQNRSRTVHTLHQGRGVYVVLRENQGRFEVEMIRVGKDVADGEKLQWIVEGGCYKASVLIPDEESSDGSSILLTSETMIPGFDYKDHDFLRRDVLREKVDRETFEGLQGLLRESFPGNHSVGSSKD